MALATLEMRIRVNKRRLLAMEQEARARLKRAPKGERGALMDRLARQIVERCMHFPCKKAD